MKMRSSNLQIRYTYIRTAKWLSAVALIALPVLVHASPAQAERRRGAAETVTAPSAWAGKRVILMLPVRTGENWKGNPDFTQALLPQANNVLRTALNAHNKFAVVEVRSFNPILMRAVQDGLATSDDLNTLVSYPTVPNANVFLSKVKFDAAPLQTSTVSAAIGSFVLESAEQDGNSVRVKLTGRMYTPGSTTALRALSATVTAPITNGSVRTATVSAIQPALDRILEEFTRYPNEREIPVIDAAATPAPVTGTTGAGIVLEAPPAEVFPATPVPTGSSTGSEGSTGVDEGVVDDGLGGVTDGTDSATDGTSDLSTGGDLTDPGSAIDVVPDVPDTTDGNELSTPPSSGDTGGNTSDTGGLGDGFENMSGTLPSDAETSTVTSLSTRSDVDVPDDELGFEE